MKFNKYEKLAYSFLMILVFLNLPNDVFCQCPDENASATTYCSGIVPTYIVDLSGDPGSTFLSCEVARDGQCNCALGSERCVEFIVTLHPDALGVVLRKATGSNASGNHDFIVNGDCANIGSLDQRYCISGVGPHSIVYCELGGNLHTYEIISVPSLFVAPTVVVAEGCNARIEVSGSIDGSTATWTGVSGNASTGYLSCTAGCLRPIFTPPANINSPTETFTYRVCANASTILCDNTIVVCKDVQVIAYPNIDVAIPNYAYCANEPSWPVAVSANPAGTHYYIWYNGPNSSSPVAGKGPGLSNFDYVGFGGGTKYVEVINQGFANIVGASCRIGADSFQIQEKAVPLAEINGPSSICSGSDLSFVATDPGLPGTTYQWTFPGGTPSSATGRGPHLVSFNSCGDVTVTLVTSLSGCTDTDMLTIPGDNTPPAFSNPPADATVSCDNVPVAPDLSAQLSDGCSGATLSYTETRIDSSCPSDYTLRRIWLATDACGNSATHIQILTVIDNQDPVVNPLPAGGTYSCQGEVPAPNKSIVSATDNCSTFSVAWVSDNYVGNCDQPLVRTYRITDACGNSTDVQQTFTLSDNTAPILTCPPSESFLCSMELPVTINTWADFLNAGGTGTDNCNQIDPSTFSVSQTSMGLCPMVITITYAVADICGNVGTCQQTIEIDPPVNTCEDGIQNGNETGIDCGGPDCAACPTCEDGIQNGNETDVDCGGSDCIACPTCDDGIQNGEEMGIDCGGSDCEACPPPCYTPQNLYADEIERGRVKFHWSPSPSEELASYRLQVRQTTQQNWYNFTTQDTFLVIRGTSEGTNYEWRVGANCERLDSEWSVSCFFIGNDPNSIECNPPFPTCEDGIQNGDETDVDCGGSCAPCEETPETPTCEDGVQNGGEIGIDCGGSCVPCSSCTTPTGLYVDNFGRRSVTLNWDVVVDATTYSLEFRVAGREKWSTYRVFRNSQSIRGIASDTDYEWRVSANCGSEDSNWSAICSFNSSNPESGQCDEIPETPTCDDGIQNGDETGIDCGGFCVQCEEAPEIPTCDDEIQNGDETGIDCGGSCAPCETPFCPTPTDLDHRVLGSSVAVLSWAAVSGVQSYVLEIRIQGLEEWASFGVRLNRYVLSRLSKGSIYNWRVKSICVEGSSDWSLASFAAGTSGSLEGQQTEDQISELHLSPNPAFSVLNIEFPVIKIPEGSLRIIDFTGKALIYKKMQRGESNAQLEITMLNKGLYFIQVESNGLILTKRFVVQ